MEFNEIAEREQVRAICLDGLQTTQQRLGANIPARVLKALAASGRPEPSAHLFQPSQWTHCVEDLRALPNWKLRFKLLGEWGFPSSDYMLQKYHTHKRHTLPFLYARRLSEGLAKFIRSRKIQKNG